MLRRMRPNARHLRVHGTDAERKLWPELRDRRLAGAKFRRQHPLGPYVADFFCIEARLVIEVDGGQHAESAHDAVRDRWMEDRGWRVLRFWNPDVLTNMDGVKHAILAALGKPLPP